MLAAYWLPSVGIGPSGKMQTVVVPITDLLNYQRKDGSPQVDVINLMGCAFNTPDNFPNQYLVFDDNLTTVLTDGSVQELQDAGIKVVLTILGSGGTSVGWSSIPSKLIPGFAAYLNESILGPGGYGLDGIDIDDEYGTYGDTLVETVNTMRTTFPPGKIISKALWNDTDVIPDIANLLTFGGIMTYGDDAGWLEEIFNQYVGLGMQPEQLTIGVNAGPVAQGGSFTSIATAQELTAWQPANGTKLGMMLWSFSQDIQQFTANPQNQPGLMFPNPGDHSWQRAIIEVFDSQ